MKIKAERWPQHGNPRRPQQRWGGGWKWRLGIDVGRSTVVINLIFGLIRIRFK